MPPSPSTETRYDRRHPPAELHADERLKQESRYLRGGIAVGLGDPLTGAVPEADAKLLKFHGIYQQSDRDLDAERRRSKLEPAYQFMLRVRLPGGVIRPQQWLALDRLAETHADGGLRLTSRQTFQFHGVLKSRLKALVQELRQAGLDSRAACGDDTRGVMCGVNPALSALHREVHELACATSAHLIPRTGAYGEIWYDTPQRPAQGEEEPLYGPTYLPRKFKIGFCLPPANDIDVLTQDLGFIAIVEDGRLAGFNLAAGGGMGRTDNHPDTYPMLATVLAFVPKDRVIAAAEASMLIQRDHGNRRDRSRARFKYTLDELGCDWFRSELERRLGEPLDPPRPFRFETRGDAFGWQRDDRGLWHVALLIPSGRIRGALKSGLAAVAALDLGELRLTPNQNLTLCGLDGRGRQAVTEALEHHGLGSLLYGTPLRRQAISCVAFPTCGLAMAESERYLPQLLDRLEAMLTAHGLGDLPLDLRVSGCPNGCARPYAAEIGLTGRGPGRYNVYLGGDALGTRLNQLWLDNVTEETLHPRLEALIARFAAERRPGEGLGDFAVRNGIVARVGHGRDVVPQHPETSP